MNQGSSYLLNFVIPQGPTGPTGPSFSLNAYGGKYNNIQQTINLGSNTQTQITLPSSMPNLNTTYTPANSITITEAGIYEINYFGNFLTSVATTLTFAVRLNGTNIPSTVISKALSVGINSTYNGSVIFYLPASSVVDLAISSLLNLNIIFGTNVNASLSVKKLTN